MEPFDVIRPAGYDHDAEQWYCPLCLVDDHQKADPLTDPGTKPVDADRALPTANFDPYIPVLGLYCGKHNLFATVHPSGIELGEGWLYIALGHDDRDFFAYTPVAALRNREGGCTISD